MMIDKAIERVRAYRRAKGWPKLKFANMAGVRESTIRQMDRPGWNPKVETLRRLESIIPQGYRVREHHKAPVDRDAPEPQPATDDAA